jgi:hypothetical protein
MKRRDLVELWKMMKEYEGSKGVKFGYFLARNRKKLQPEIEALEEAITPNETYKTYDIKRVKLAEFYSDKDSNGSPVIRNSNYVIDEKLDEFNTELASLKEKYKTVIDDREKQIIDYNKMLDEEAEFDGFKIDLNALPDEVDSKFIEVLMNTELLNEPE